MELPRLDRLHVHDADDLLAGDDWDREHRDKALLVDAGDPFEPWIGPHVARRERHPGVRDPAGDALADPQRGAADAAAVQAVRGDEAKDALGALEQIQG